MDLTSAQKNKKYVIASLAGDQTVCRRLLDMGFAPGSEIMRESDAPYGDTVLVTLRGRMIALRRSAAALITVEPHGH